MSSEADSDGASGAGLPAAAPPPPLPVADATASSPVAPKRGFAGFSWGQLLGGVAIVGTAVWGAWVTREVVVLQQARTVSVSLASMANDFVMAEARAGVSPEQAEVDTRHYMATLQDILRQRAAKGEIILVSEAVVTGSVPDITPEVREAVGKAITASPPPRVPASAQPAPPAPVLPSAVSPQSGSQIGAPLMPGG